MTRQLDEAALRRAPAEAQRELRKLREGRSVSKADFRGLLEMSSGLLRMILQAVLEHPTCQKLDLKVRLAWGVEREGARGGVESAPAFDYRILMRIGAPRREWPRAWACL